MGEPGWGWDSIPGGSVGVPRVPNQEGGRERSSGGRGSAMGLEELFQTRFMGCSSCPAVGRGMGGLLTAIRPQKC